MLSRASMRSSPLLKMPDNEIRAMQHEIARLRAELQDRIEIHESRYGPVAYRRWNEYKMEYDFIDCVTIQELIDLGYDENDGWEPLYVHHSRQKAI